jgi:hypothetical protein
VLALKVTKQEKLLAVQVAQMRRFVRVALDVK